MTKVYQILLLLSVITLLNGCCWIKVRFTDEEMKWLDVYNVGDTLIFMSQHGDFDTTYIIEKKIRHTDCNPIISHGLYLPILGDIHYGRTPDEKVITTNKLLSMVKSYNRTSLFISYLYTGVFFIDIKEDEVYKYKDGKVYTFERYHDRAKPEYPKALYWHEDYGIIKYITHEGIEWKRINLNFEVE